jgi:hypothetical protein
MQTLYRPPGFQQVEAPIFQDNRQMKVVRMSALRTGRLYPQEILLLLTYAISWADSRDIVRPEELCQWKTPKTPSGIEPATSPACSIVPQSSALPRGFKHTKWILMWQTYNKWKSKGKNLIEITWNLSRDCLPFRAEDRDKWSYISAGTTS